MKTLDVNTPTAEQRAAFLKATEPTEVYEIPAPFWDRFTRDSNRVLRWTIALVGGLALAQWFVLEARAEGRWDHLVTDNVPPAHYASMPDVQTVVNEIPVEQIAETCGQLIGQYATGSASFWGCQRFVGSWCVVYVPTAESTSAKFAAMMREHETAHCKGWVHPVQRWAVQYPTATTLIAHTQDRR